MPPWEPHQVTPRRSLHFWGKDRSTGSLFVRTDHCCVPFSSFHWMGGFFFFWQWAQGLLSSSAMRGCIQPRGGQGILSREPRLWTLQQLVNGISGCFPGKAVSVWSKSVKKETWILSASRDYSGWACCVLTKPTSFSWAHGPSSFTRKHGLAEF